MKPGQSSEDISFLSQLYQSSFAETVNRKMNLLLTLILAITVGAYAEPQFYPSYFNGNNYFRAGLPEPSYEEQKSNYNGGRFLLPTLSLTFATTTVSSSTTITTTCTTSTAALIQCTNSGRRRRGVLLTDNKNTDGLFYSEEEDKGHFLPPVPT